MPLASCRPTYRDPVVASPAHYRVLARDATTRVLRFELPPGQRDAWHGHPKGAYYVVRGGRVRIHRGATHRDVTLTSGKAGLQAAQQAHSIENIGDTVVVVVMVELGR